MKDNKLIFEINRIGQLMGSNKELPLIVEVNLWLRLLNKYSFSNVDDLIKIFRTRVGPNISAKEIDDLIKELGNSITQAEKTSLKNALVSHLDEINRSTDSFFEILKRNQNRLDPIFEKLTNDSGVITRNLVNDIEQKIINKTITESTEFTAMVVNYVNHLIRQLTDINNLGVIINSETDLLKLIKNDIRKSVKTHLANNKDIVVQNVDTYIDGIYNATISDPKFTSIIQKLRKEGTIANNVPKKIPLNDFSNIYARTTNGEIIYKPTEAIIGVPELSRTVDGEIETLPIDVSNKYDQIKDKAYEILSNTEKEFINDVNGWLRNTTETNQIGFNRQPDNYLNTTDEVMSSYYNLRTLSPDDISISDSLLDLNGNIVGNWSSIFYNKIFRGNLPDFLINLFRKMINIRKDPSFFVRQYEKTADQILETYDLLGKSLDGDKADATYYSLIDTLGKLQRKLKLDLELAQKFKDPVFNTTDERLFHIMFEELAQKIEKESGLNFKESSELLKKLRGEKESGGGFLWTSEQSIENMIRESKRYNLPFGQRLNYEWEKIKGGSSVAEFKTIGDDLQKAVGRANKLEKGLLITVQKIIKSPKTWMYIFFNSFTHLGTVIKLLKGRGSFTLLRSLANYATTYLYLQILQFIVIPVTDILFLAGYNWYMRNFNPKKTDKIDTEITKERILKEFAEQIPFVGQQWKWYPYSEPFSSTIGSVDVPLIEMRPSPIPDHIMKWIRDVFASDSGDANVAASKKDYENKQKQLTEEWNELQDEDGQKLRNAYTSGFTKFKGVLNVPDKSKEQFGLTPTESKTLSDHLFFKTPQTIQNDLELVEDNNNDEDLKVKSEKLKEKMAKIMQDLKEVKLRAPFWVCLKPPKINDFGEPIGCDGTSYRVVINNYKNVIYNNSIDNMKCFDSHLYYVTKTSNQENMGLPNTGSNGTPTGRIDELGVPICNHPNLRPIKELISSLK